MADRNDDILTAALEYASRGWLVLPLREGKIPRLKAWQKAATTDPEVIRGWWRQWPDSNVGIKLGPDSGIIDVECDSDAAEATLSALFDGTFPLTPTWQSNRGKHRMFRYRPDLPAPDKNGFKVGEKERAVEFRTGNGGKGAQSVFPPSRHPSGPLYRWLVSPNDCEVAEIPQIVFAKLWNFQGEDLLGPAVAGCIDVAERARRYLATLPPAVSGQRGHDATFRAACVLVLGFSFDLDQAMPLLREFSDRCEPPWSDKDLRHKLESATKQAGERGYLLNRQAGLTPLVSRDREAKAFIDELLSDLRDLFNANSVERTWASAQAWNDKNRAVSAMTLKEIFESALQSHRGTRANEDFDEPFSPDRPFSAAGEEKPFWRLVIVESKPRVYKLWSPLWSTKAPEGYIELTSAQMHSPEGIRHQALEQADAWVNRNFNKLWEGDKDVPSLAKQLIDAAEYEPAPLETKRDMLVASLLYEKLLGADTRKVTEDKDPTVHGGMPCRLENGDAGKPGNVVFMFKKVFEDMARGDFKIKERELSAILVKLGVGEETYGPKSGRRNMKVMSQEQLNKLRKWLRIRD